VKLLVDANRSPVVALILARAGNDAVHVADVGLLTASDKAIAGFAHDSGRCVITSDSDFGTILARTKAVGPSVNLLRHTNDIAPGDQAELVKQALAVGEKALRAGAVVTISRDRIRVRDLPIA